MGDSLGPNFLGRFLGVVRPFTFMQRHVELLFPAVLLSSLVIIMIPMPPLALDIMLSVSLLTSVLLLLLSIHVRSPIDLNGFPSMLVVTTMLRLAVNIASTRRILLTGRPGHVIEAIGQLMLGGDLGVGIIVFAILTLVQLVVVVKGAERVAEVSARFTLDSIPGKQMSIDADLRGGGIDMAEARRRRQGLENDAQLYGALDGSMKFIKGDALAGLIITGVNLLGGLFLGVSRDGLSLRDALQLYAILSIGDALASQIPSMLLSQAAGMMVTRLSQSGESMSRTLFRQMSAYANPLAVGGGFMLLLGLIPGMPTYAFSSLGAIFLLLAYAKVQEDRPAPEIGLAAAATDTHEAPGAPTAPSLGVPKLGALSAAALDSALPAPTPLLVELGAELYSVPRFGATLADVVLPKVRDALFFDLGFRLPQIRVRMNPHLKNPLGFVLHVHEVPCLVGSADPKKALVEQSPLKLKLLGMPAEEYLHPESGASLSMVHISEPEMAEKIGRAGYSIQEPVEIIGVEVKAALRKHVARFIGIQETQEILDRLEKACPAIVREVVPRHITTPRLAEILRYLVSEGVPVRDLKHILEAVAQHAPMYDDPRELAEAIRGELRELITYRYAGVRKQLAAYLLAPEIEEAIRDAADSSHSKGELVMDPEIAGQINAGVKKLFKGKVRSKSPVFLTSPDIRWRVRLLLASMVPEAVVLSTKDLSLDLTITPIGCVRVE